MSFSFCPTCGQALETVTLEQYERQRCVSCGCVFYQNSKPTASAIIIQDSKILLVKRSREPQKNKLPRAKARWF